MVTVKIPRSFTEGGKKIGNGSKSVDEATAQRWVESGKATLSTATIPEGVVVIPVSEPDPLDAVPFVAGAYGKGEAPHWVKEFKAIAKANQQAGGGEATVTVTKEVPVTVTSSNKETP